MSHTCSAPAIQFHAAYIWCSNEGKVFPLWRFEPADILWLIFPFFFFIRRLNLFGRAFLSPFLVSVSVQLSEKGCTQGLHSLCMLNISGQSWTRVSGMIIQNWISTDLYYEWMKKMVQFLPPKLPYFIIKNRTSIQWPQKSYFLTPKS